MGLFDDIGKGIGNFFASFGRKDEDEEKRRQNAQAFQSVQNGTVFNTSNSQFNANNDSSDFAERMRQQREEQERKRREEEERKRKEEEARKKAEAEKRARQIEQAKQAIENGGQAFGVAQDVMREAQKQADPNKVQQAQQQKTGAFGQKPMAQGGAFTQAQKPNQLQQQQQAQKRGVFGTPLAQNKPAFNQPQRDAEIQAKRDAVRRDPLAAWRNAKNGAEQADAIEQARDILWRNEWKTPEGRAAIQSARTLINGGEDIDKYDKRNFWQGMGNMITGMGDGMREILTRTDLQKMVNTAESGFGTGKTNRDLTGQDIEKLNNMYRRGEIDYDTLEKAFKDSATTNNTNVKKYGDAIKNISDINFNIDREKGITMDTEDKGILGNVARNVGEDAGTMIRGGIEAAQFAPVNGARSLAGAGLKVVAQNVAKNAAIGGIENAALEGLLIADEASSGKELSPEDIAARLAMTAGFGGLLEVPSSLGAGRNIVKGIKKAGDADPAVKINPLTRDQWSYNKDALVGALRGDVRQRQSKTAFNILQDKRAGSPYATSDGLEVSLSRNGNRKMTLTSQKTPNEMLTVQNRLAPKIDEAIQASKMTDNLPDLKQHGFAKDGFKYYEVPVGYRGKEYITTFDIGSNNGENLLYNATTRKSPTKPAGTNPNTELHRLGDSVDSIPNRGEKVNTMAEPEVVRTETPSEMLQAEAEAQNPVKREVVAETGNGERIVEETTPEGVKVTKKENPELDAAIEQARQRQAYENAKSGNGGEFDELTTVYRGLSADNDEALEKMIRDMADPEVAPRSNYKLDESEGYFLTNDLAEAEYYMGQSGKPSQAIVAVDVPANRFAEISKENANRPADFNLKAIENGTPNDQAWQAGIDAYNKYIDDNNFVGRMSGPNNYFVTRNAGINNVRKITNNAGEMLPEFADMNKPQKTGIVKNLKAEANQPVAVLEQEMAKPSKQGVVKGLKSNTDDVMQPLNNPKNKVFDGANRRERGFLETIKNDPNTRPELAQELNDMYYVRDTNELQTKAANLVREDPELAASVAKNTNGDVGVAVGSEYLKYLQDAGRFEEALDLADNLARRLTEAGRTAQAASIYGRLTPEGVLRFAQKEVARYNQEAGRIGKKKLAQITAEQANGLVDKAKKIQALPEGREKNLMIGELQRDINDLIPSSITDKALTVWKAGLLTSLRTHERNMVGNTLSLMANEISRAPAALVDRAISKVTGQRTITAGTPNAMKGFVKGVKEGARNAKDALKDGANPIENLKYDRNQITWGNNKFEQGLKKYTEAVFRPLGAEDKVFEGVAYNMSLRNQANAMALNEGLKGKAKAQFIDDLVNNPTSKMIDVAQADADFATFKQSNALSKAASGLKQKASSQGAIPKIISDVIMPFTQVPGGVATQLYNYSPAGFVSSVMNVRKAINTGDASFQRLASTQAGRAMIGTSLMAAGAWLSSQGLMTGQPRDNQEKAQWEAEGKQANAIKLGDKWVSLNSIGPQTLITVSGAAIDNMLKDGMDPLSIAGTIGASIGQNIADQSFLTGVQSAMNAITNPEQYAKNFIEGQATSIVPNLVKDIAKATDPYQRDTAGMADRFKQSIPGLSQTLPKRYNSYGEEMHNRGLGAIFDLFNTTTENISPEKAYIDELRRITGEKSMTPDRADRKVDIEKNGVKEKVQLTSEQHSAYQKDYGENTQQLLKVARELDWFRELSPEEQASRIDQALKSINQASQNRVLGDETKLNKKGEIAFNKEQGWEEKLLMNSDELKYGRDGSGKKSKKKSKKSSKKKSSGRKGSGSSKAEKPINNSAINADVADLAMKPRAINVTLYNGNTNAGKGIVKGIKAPQIQTEAKIEQLQRGRVRT